MKLEEIQELWNRDRDIDIEELATESTRIPQIHDKYLKIYIDERIRLKGLEFELAKIIRLKTDYYAGRMAQEDLDNLGWEPFLTKILKTEMGSYLDSDEDIFKLKRNITVMQEKINYLDSIIKMINNRGFQIKSAIDWIKFKSGIV
jgi:hypothetical protein|tara:strand:- start:1217 stop:1654 length:438 start_codon:yes stop_codon:yes gene_type:complete